MRATSGAGGRRPRGGAAVALLGDVDVLAAARLPTGIDELDRVLGGGLVPGSLVLIGGEPGVGKSSLLLQALAAVAAAGGRTLLVCGEESPAQVRLRAQRLGAGDAIRVLADTDLDTVCETIAAEAPAVCVVDSVQTMRSADLQSAPGSVAQVREAAERLLRVAKRGQTAIVLVGHVTKDGTVAGPARARAPRRRRAAVRGRPLPPPARAAGGQEPLRVDRRDRHLRDDRRRPAPGRRPVRGAGRARAGRAGLGAPAGDRGHAPDRARGAGARGRQRPGHAAAAGDRLRPQPAVDDRGGARPPRRRRARRLRRLRERRRRCARRRAGRRPGGRARHRLVGARRRRAAPARLLRRARADRPGAARVAHRPAPGRGCQAGRGGPRLPAEHRPAAAGGPPLRCAGTLEGAIGLAFSHSASTEGWA